MDNRQQPLGGFLADFQRKLREGSPSDRCVLCGDRAAPLHPVENAWACSRCNTPPDDEERGF